LILLPLLLILLQNLVVPFRQGGLRDVPRENRHPLSPLVPVAHNVPIVRNIHEVGAEDAFLLVDRVEDPANHMHGTRHAMVPALLDDVGNLRAFAAGQHQSRLLLLQLRIDVFRELQHQIVHPAHHALGCRGSTGVFLPFAQACHSGLSTICVNALRTSQSRCTAMNCVPNLVPAGFSTCFPFPPFTCGLRM
ncbi:unnamed protein product, partial [Closterium sp. NIES-54]